MIQIWPKVDLIAADTWGIYSLCINASSNVSRIFPTENAELKHSKSLIDCCIGYCNESPAVAKGATGIMA